MDNTLLKFLTEHYNILAELLFWAIARVIIILETTTWIIFAEKIAKTAISSFLDQDATSQ